MDFSSKVALVTGASSGIGRSLAVQLQGRGARVVLAARNAEKLESLADELRAGGGEALACPTDVTRQDELDRLVEQTLSHFGALDVLVNNAGAGHYADVIGADLDEVRQTFELNFFAPVYLMNKAWPMLARGGGGAVVNVSSTAGFRSWPGNGYYCATKHALNAVTESLLVEQGGGDVQVLLVMPGTTNTEFIANSRNVPDEVRRNPPQDMAPDEVAAQVLAALAKGRSRVVLTTKGRLIHYLNRLSPGLVDGILRRGRQPRAAAAEVAP